MFHLRWNQLRLEHRKIHLAMPVRPFFMQYVMQGYPLDFGDGFNDAPLTIDEYQGKLYIGGYFTSYDGTAANRIISLNLDGSINTDFNYGSGFNGYVIKIKVIDGKIWAMGTFTTYKLGTRNHAVCLNPDGSVNTDLDLGTGFNGTVQDVCVMDGYYHFGGNFATFNGTTHKYIVRMNSSGTVDEGDSGYPFHSGTGSYNLTATVTCLATDGTNLFVGGGGSVSGHGANIFALLSTGRFSTTFVTGSGFNGAPNYLFHLGDFLYCCGPASTYNGSSCPLGFLYLYKDGSLPSQGFANFGGGTGTRRMIMSGTNYVLVGDFSTYDGDSYGKIIGLHMFYETPEATFNGNAGIGFYKGMTDLIEVNGKIYVIGSGNVGYPNYYKTSTNYVYGIIRLYIDGKQDT